MINYTLFFQVIVYAALFSTRARTGLTLESVANKNQQICKKEKGSEKVGGNGLLFAAPTLFHCLGCISAYMYIDWMETPRDNWIFYVIMLRVVWFN